VLAIKLANARNHRQADTRFHASHARDKLDDAFSCRAANEALRLAVMQINYQQAKTLCTDAEFQILASVKPQALAAMKPAELRSLASKARKYSDKWLAQSRKQGNSTDGAGARSFTKHELFKEAVTRIEAKLEKATLAKPAAKKVVTKSAPAKKAAKKAAVAKKPAKKAAPIAPAKKAASKKAVKAAAKKVAKKAVSSRARDAMSLANQAKQKSIGTGLRMATSGKNSRVRGHVSAQGRRNQAARSARKR